MTLVKGLLVAAVGIGFPMAASAAIVDIEELSFDLDQFAGAYVTTDASSSAFASAVFENAAGVDGYEVGELAGRPNGTYAGSDHGDRITLGDDDPQKYLTLHYGAGVTIGSGQASKFAVYEQASSNSGTDPEGHYYEISVNGGAFVDARNYPLHQTPISANYQNRILFDFLDTDFGLSVGDALQTVTIRNILGSSSNSDPDILFMARAGVVSTTPIPLPASLPILAAGLGLLGLVGRRRSRRA